MPVLDVGRQAPDFTLRTVDGTTFSLKEALAEGPVVLAFFKISCPICQYAFPYLDRLHRALKGSSVTVIGVSQDGPNETRSFMREFGVTFKVAIDDESNHFAVSNAYGLTNVPTVVEIAPDGTIESAIVGWSRDEVVQIYTRHAHADSATPLYRPDEEIAAFRAG